MLLYDLITVTLSIFRIDLNLYIYDITNTLLLVSFLEEQWIANRCYYRRSASALESVSVWASLQAKPSGNGPPVIRRQVTPLRRIRWRRRYSVKLSTEERVKLLSMSFLIISGKFINYF